MRGRHVDPWARATLAASAAALLAFPIWVGSIGALETWKPPEIRSPRLHDVTWDREIAPPTEPGRRLVLEGNARRFAGGKALPALVFFIYQADALGRYGPPGPDSAKARLSGFVKTGPDGQFRIRTILPGTYGGPPHLHFEFRDSLGAMRVSFLNLFPPLEGNYAAYGSDFSRSHWKSTPGVKRTWVSGSLGRLLIEQPADLDIYPDSSGVFRVKWDLDVSLSAPHPEHPGWGPEVSRADYPAHWWAPVPREGSPAWEILPQEAGPGEVILSKRHELGLLSNFAPTPFVFRGRPYASLEGFWQMMLYPEDENDPRARYPGLVWKHTRDEVAGMTSFEAKKAGDLAEENMRKMHIGWVSFEGRRFDYRSAKPAEHNRLIVAATREKVRQNAEVQRVLLATGDLDLRPDHHQEPDAPPEWRYFEILTRIRAELMAKR